VAAGTGAGKPSFLLWPALKALVAAKLLERLGGRLRIAGSGGAALNPQIARTFNRAGLRSARATPHRGFPLCSVNRLGGTTPPPSGVLAGIEVAFGDHGVLLVRGPSVMLGYWRNPEATATVLDAAGWLDTGDQAKLENGLLYITGRIKEIIVMANGEKVPPVDMELAIQLDPLLEQALVVGEGKPYLGALVALDMDEWHQVAEAEGCRPIPRRGARTRGEARSRAHRAGRCTPSRLRQVRRWRCATSDGGQRPAHATSSQAREDPRAPPRRVARSTRHGRKDPPFPSDGLCHEPRRNTVTTMKRDP